MSACKATRLSVFKPHFKEAVSLERVVLLHQAPVSLVKGAWEPEPVEECVQSTLAALYPPFEATAPTLLSQVFEVLERTYQHDALRYTLDFLVPAKHILARVQSEACAQYSGFVFCHEGWPLCLREKILVQLGSLPWQRLCPGDFYLQVVPHRDVQELPVSPDSYPFLFTVEWLNGINKERRGGRLERCLLAAGEKVLSLPWPELVYPQFVHKDGFIVGQRCPADLAPEVLGARSPGDGRHSGGENRESEGEYVHLLEVSPTLHQAPRIPEPCGAQIQTMPTRKGHNKSRSRRHRAWLHHKSGCGENFALRKASKAQQAERSGQDSSPAPEDRTDHQGGEPSHALCPTLEASQAVESPSPGSPEQDQGPFGADSRPAIFGGPAPEDSKGPGKPELPEVILQDPASCREGSHENRAPASATPKRASKGNRRKKKGVGRGAGGRPRQVGDLNSKETGTCVETKDAVKEEPCLGPGEQDSGSGEPGAGTREEAVSTKECPGGIPDCVQKNSGIPGDQSVGSAEEEVGVRELVVGTRECSVGPGELESGSGNCSPGVTDSSVGTAKESVGAEDPKSPSAEEQAGAVGSGEPGNGAEEPSVSATDQGTVAEGRCPGGLDRAGRPLLMVVPQPLRDELPPGQDDLVNTLRYLHSRLRQELKALGLTVLLDLTQVDDWALQAPVLLPALRTFQEGSPPPVSQLLVILPPDDRFVPHEEELVLEPAVEVRALSLSELPRFVALDQLTPTLGGTLQHSPLRWVGAHQALEQLQTLCYSVLQAVCVASTQLQPVGTAASPEELSAQITLHQETMQKLLSEPQLLELQRRGGALLAQLPPLGLFSTEAVAATRLYQEVDEALHRLVQLSNRRLEELQQERPNTQVISEVSSSASGEKLQLYATYAKDHHKLQAATTSLRTAGKKGPVELREDGPLARTLRVPLEQLDRYRRFLGELLRDCELERAPDRQALQEAQELLEGLEQRGRDLLAAEQIRGCEIQPVIGFFGFFLGKAAPFCPDYNMGLMRWVKLSEQGPLLQRGELTVICGRRKCQRHIFLFERLLLFTKCKGAEGGYACKQALQTASMGLTESVGPSGLRFELWFGRGPNRQAYTLQATSAEAKRRWTSVISQLLWKQAVPMSVSSSPTQHLAPLGLGPGPPPGLSLPGHVEEEEWDLDVKPIPRAETSDSEGASPSHRELPSQSRASLPGSNSASAHHQSAAELWRCRRTSDPTLRLWRPALGVESASEALLPEQPWKAGVSPQDREQDSLSPPEPRGEGGA
ncbi:hypothetical protein lerEdw1_010207 [Lerista edwardsae]|nr:hypothetical protein lerEdw1_010207 [Lerista edwardsae]